MSHDYGLLCKCGEETYDAWNHADERLRAAVEDSYALYVFSKSRWGKENISRLEWEDYMQGLAHYLVEHFDHGGFFIKSEYYKPEEPDKYPLVPVFPVVPDLLYTSICLDHLEKRSAELVKQANEIKQRMAAYRKEVKSNG